MRRIVGGMAIHPQRAGGDFEDPCRAEKDPLISPFLPSRMGGGISLNQIASRSLSAQGEGDENGFGGGEGAELVEGGGGWRVAEIEGDGVGAAVAGCGGVGE